MRVSRKNIREYLGLRNINPVIKILTMSDVAFMSGLGMVAPIFAIYVTDQINAGIEAVGIATTIYLLTKSVGQLFVAEIIDRIKGERDDYWSVVIGSVFIGLVPIAYIFVESATQLYVVQFVYGLASAFTFPSWMAIFTRHIDKNREGIEWGMYYTLTDLMGAVSAALGGFFVVQIGFDKLFVLVSVLSLIGAFYLFLISRYLNDYKR